MIFSHTLDLLDPRVAEFEHRAADVADHMVVLCIVVRLFEVGNILTELVLGNQSAIKQDLNCVIERSPTDPVILVLHFDIERLNIKMVF